MVPAADGTGLYRRDTLTLTTIRASIDTTYARDPSSFSHRDFSCLSRTCYSFVDHRSSFQETSATMI